MTTETLPGWPGFEPDRIPLAVFDGERTVLIGHPSPPPEFIPDGTAWVYPGRHRAVTANTSVSIGDVLSATLLEPPPDRLDSLAGLETSPAPEKIRRYVYHSGEALALLLEAFAPGWKDRVETEDAWLDEVLAQAMSESGDVVSAEFHESERDRFASEAERDAGLVVERRERSRAESFASGGRASLTATGEPFQCTAFDPINVTYLDDGEVLHTRILGLRGPGFELELMNGAAITHGPEDNPIFGGIDRAHF